MTRSDAPPTVDSTRLDEWSETTVQRERVFSQGFVTVTATTAVYDDAALRTAIRDRTDLDQSWRFFFASRLTITPTSPVSRALRSLVTERAKEGFVDRLRDRGFEQLDAAGSRRLRIGGERASAFRYTGRLALSTVELTVAGWLAVWPAGNEFRIAGGAFPTGVTAADDADVQTALSEFVDADRFREELFALIRSTE